MTLTTQTRGHTPRTPPRRATWIWILMVWSLIAAAVVAAVLLWPDGDETATVGLSENPPFGLTEIQMPDTEGAAIAVLEGMPEIDGRQPTFLRDGGVVVYGGTEAEAPSSYRSIRVLPADEPPESAAGAVQQAVASAQQSGTVTVEASALDAEGDLVWAVITDERTQDGIPAFTMIWAEPNGSWIFDLTGDSADFRVKLVHAFISAAGD